jgi:hypothetical protein
MSDSPYPETLREMRNSIRETQINISETTNSQDFQQKSSTYSTLIIELYRVLMGSLLLVFVPQKCGDDICSMTELATDNNSLHNTTFAFNLVSLCAFVSLYVAEVRRETKLITYLEVDKEVPTDDDAVGEALTRLPTEKKEALWSLDSQYQKTSYIALGSFLINTGLSGYTVFQNYLDDKTVSVFITNTLFMALKLKEAYDITNTKKNIFYSAYLTQPVQYNNVDPDKVNTVSENVSSEEVDTC